MTLSVRSCALAPAACIGRYLLRQTSCTSLLLTGYRPTGQTDKRTVRQTPYRYTNVLYRVPQNDNDVGRHSNVVQQSTDFDNFWQVSYQILVYFIASKINASALRWETWASKIATFRLITVYWFIRKHRKLLKTFKLKRDLSTLSLHSHKNDRLYTLNK